MTKQEKAMFEKMMGMMQDMGNRIEQLEKRNSVAKATSTTPSSSPKATPKAKAAKAESKKTKADTATIGGLRFSGKYVAVDSIKNSKVRYAIQMAITERFNGVKLKKGNPVYDKAYAKNKYVQVYEFKTLKDAQAFYDDQLKRVG